MHILISPNAFKNSLSASQAADAIEKGLTRSKLICTTQSFPIADGGDGTAELITRLCQGTFTSTTVRDPLGRVIEAKFGIIDDGTTAVIDIASASGLRLLSADQLNPLQTSTYGTGELIKAALNTGFKKILIGVGGSATVDGGAGILEALGARFYDNKGNAIYPIPENLINLSSIDLRGLDERIKECNIKILCDVKNKLLGKTGAASIFGPQKGASPGQVEVLEAALSRLNQISFETTGIQMDKLLYGGAAGGVAAGLHTYLNAKLVNGIDQFLTITAFNDSLKKADLVITGEGSLDEQTLEGKGPYGVAYRCLENNIPVIGLAGRIPSHAMPALEKYFTALFPINYQTVALEEALKRTGENLSIASTQVGNLIHFSNLNKAI